jgi:hypothetical protein
MLTLPALLATELPLLLVRLVDETPKPEDVKAGWTAFAIFLLLGLAVVVLGFSLTKQLRKAKAAEAAGVYGDPDPDLDRRTRHAPVVDPQSPDEPPRPTERP